LHQIEDEPEGEQVSAFDFDFELYSLKIPEYKELIYQEIKLYHEESAVEDYLKNKRDYPQGVLYKQFGKERLRTMYKADKLEPSKLNQTAASAGKYKK
jgi:hypothetical protein